MERPNDHDRCPKPNMLPQPPAEFDSEDTQAQNNGGRESHLCFAQISKNGKHRQQHDTDDSTRPVGTRFLLGSVVIKHLPFLPRHSGIALVPPKEMSASVSPMPAPAESAPTRESVGFSAPAEMAP